MKIETHNIEQIEKRTLNCMLCVMKIVEQEKTASFEMKLRKSETHASACDIRMNWENKSMSCLSAQGEREREWIVNNNNDDNNRMYALVINFLLSTYYLSVDKLFVIIVHNFYDNNYDFDLIELSAYGC